MRRSALADDAVFDAMDGGATVRLFQGLQAEAGNQATRSLLGPSGPAARTVQRDEQDDDSAAAAPAPAGGMSDPNAPTSYPGDVSPSPTAAAAPLGPAAVATGVDAAATGAAAAAGGVPTLTGLGGSDVSGPPTEMPPTEMPPTEMPPTEMPPTEAVPATEPNIQVNPDSLQGVDPMADTLPNPLDNLDQNPQGSWTQQAGPAENAAGNAAGTAAEDAAGPLGEAVPQTLRSAGVNAGQAAGTAADAAGTAVQGGGVLDSVSKFFTGLGSGLTAPVIPPLPTNFIPPELRVPTDEPFS